jgi:hypothetical protein
MMKKTANELAGDVLGEEAASRKRKERWISSLTSGALGTATAIALRNKNLGDIPSGVFDTTINGLIGAELPRLIWRDPKENANDPRWWRKDYSPVEHGVALGTGSGLGLLAGTSVLNQLKSRGMLIPDKQRPFKGTLGTLATLVTPTVAGYLGARQLMRARDARRDAAAQPDLDAQIPDSPATI